jgi:glutathione-specific gamma-glutamylcyclotransferase
MGRADMSEPAFQLNRAFLESGGLDEALRAAGYDHMLMPEAARRASLDAALAARPDVGGGAWVFCYGSLIWNPMIEVAERRLVSLDGWERAFCLITHAGRGTREAPGLLLGLIEGGACTGVALRIEEAIVERELALLWRREMLTGAYVPRWLASRDTDGAPVHALAFTMNTAHPNYVHPDEDTTVRMLATARGTLGTSADYLLRTSESLRRNGIDDAVVERLATRVAAWQD